MWSRSIEQIPSGQYLYSLIQNIERAGSPTIGARAPPSSRVASFLQSKKQRTGFIVKNNNSMNMKKEIPLHTTTEEPEDTIPFTMTYSSVWKAYESGDLTSDKFLIFCILCHLVNPFDGKGRTSYQKIVAILQKSPTKQNINLINKCMVELRDRHKLIWFPEHSGSRGFIFVTDKYKLAPIKEKTPQRWVDVKKYTEEKRQNIEPIIRRGIAESTIQPLPNQGIPNPSFERRRSGSFEPISDDLEERYGRGSQTEND